ARQEKDRKRDAQECYNKHDEVVLPVAHAFETEFSITGSLPSFRGHQNGCSGSIAVVSSLTRRLRTGPGEPIRIRRSYSHIAAPDSQYAISPRARAQLSPNRVLSELDLQPSRDGRRARHPAR